MLPALLLALAESRALHPTSISHTTLLVEGAAIHQITRLQAQSLIEALALDLDRDQLLSEAELLLGRAAIESTLASEYRILLCGSDGERALVGLLERLTIEPPDPSEILPAQWIGVGIEYQAASPIGAFTVESRLFRERILFHADFLRVSWNDEEPVQCLLDAEAPRLRFEPSAARRPSVIGQFVRLGLEHILTGYDHLAFLVALIVASRRLRSLLGVVTAFTLAHSLTLGYAALRSVDGRAPLVSPRLVELAIALSIAYVACDNLIRRAPRAPWGSAFGFGLLHGLGFAGFLGEALAGEPLVVSALFGFNAGVELGQIAVVVAAVILLRLLPRHRQEEAGEAKAIGLAPAWLALSSSAVVALLGLYWFTQRAGWIG
jgi:hypothetical protein